MVGCSSNLFTPDFYQFYTKFALFTLNLHIVYINPNFSGEFPRVVERVNLVQILCIPGKLLVNKQTFMSIGLLSVNVF